MIRTILALPLLIVLVVFALSNPDPVTLGMWPTDYSWQGPLSVIMLIGMAAAFLIGAALVWVSLIGARARARRAERALRRRDDEMRVLTERLARATEAARIDARLPVDPRPLPADPRALAGPRATH